MKKLSELSIADLVSLLNYLSKEIERYSENSYLKENYQIRIIRVENEIDNRISDIEDLKI
jgi:hypothetical protein